MYNFLNSIKNGTINSRLVMLLLIAFLLLIVSSREITQAPEIEQPAEFDFKQVQADLTQLVDFGPKPLGSEAHDNALKFLVDRLNSIGLSPEVQESYECSTYSCGFVQNVIARIDTGETAGNAVLVSAHYDTVAASPGASDDGIGVATILELSRIFKQNQSALKQDLIILLTDGEEFGLLGARAFTRHQWFQDVKAVVNLEARGSNGPAFLFETLGTNAETMQNLAKYSPYLSINSVLNDLYQLMPNTTDMEVYKYTEKEIIGLNFAFAGNSQIYHASTDNIENLNINSAKHLGVSALSAVKYFTESADYQYSNSNLAYMDVFGVGITIEQIYLMAMLFFVTAIFVIVHHKNSKGTWRGHWIVIRFFLLSFIAAVTLSYLLIFLATQLTASGSLPVGTHSDIALRWLLLLAVFASVTFTARYLGEEFNAHQCFSLLIVVNLVLCVVTLFLSTGLSILFVTPAVLLTAAKYVQTLTIQRHVKHSISYLLMALMLYPLVKIYLLIEVMFSFSLIPVNVLLLASLFYLTVPFWKSERSEQKRRAYVMSGWVAVASLIVMIASANMWLFKDYAVQINHVRNAQNGQDYLVFHEYATPIPADLVQSEGFDNVANELYPWDDTAYPVKSVNSHSQPEYPQFSIVNKQSVGKGIIVDAQIISPRNADVVRILLKPPFSPNKLTVNGVNFDALTSGETQWVSLYGVGSKGASLQMSFDNTPENASVVVVDEKRSRPSEFVNLMSKYSSVKDVDEGNVDILINQSQIKL